MLLIEKIDALLHGVTRRDMDLLKPEQRKRFAALCRHVAEMAEPSTRVIAPKAGVLSALSRGDRAL